MTPIFTLKDDDKLKLTQVMWDKVRKGWYAAYVPEIDVKVQSTIEVRVGEEEAEMVNVPVELIFVEFKATYPAFEVFIGSGRVVFGDVVILTPEASSDEVTGD